MKFKAKVIIYGSKRAFPHGTGYRPHLAEKNSNNLLGIEFISFSDNRITDEYVDCVIRTSYSWVDYKELKEGQAYDIREGLSVVGEIILLKLIE
ncbi:MAG: hypothetical protein WCD89_18760 [Anaerocolumna sp.]